MMLDNNFEKKNLFRQLTIFFELIRIFYMNSMHYENINIILFARILENTIVRLN